MEEEKNGEKLNWYVGVTPMVLVAFRSSLTPCSTVITDPEDPRFDLEKFLLASDAATS